MGTSVASFGGLGLAPAQVRTLAVRAVAPAPASPILRDQPRRPQAQAPAQPPPQPQATAVAFAPAAMSVLIEAQERLSHPAPPIQRQQTSDKIDRLIFRMAGTDAPADASFGVRQLEAVRHALDLAPASLGGLDLRA